MLETIENLESEYYNKTTEYITGAYRRNDQLIGKGAIFAIENIDQIFLLSNPLMQGVDKYVIPYNQISGLDWTGRSNLGLAEWIGASYPHLTITLTNGDEIDISPDEEYDNDILHELYKIIDKGIQGKYTKNIEKQINAERKQETKEEKQQKRAVPKIIKTETGESQLVYGKAPTDDLKLIKIGAIAGIKNAAIFLMISSIFWLLRDSYQITTYGDSNLLNLIIIILSKILSVSFLFLSIALINRKTNTKKNVAIFLMISSIFWLLRDSYWIIQYRWNWFNLVSIITPISLLILSVALINRKTNTKDAAIFLMISSIFWLLEDLYLIIRPFSGNFIISILFMTLPILLLILSIALINRKTNTKDVAIFLMISSIFWLLEDLYLIIRPFYSWHYEYSGNFIISILFMTIPISLLLLSIALMSSKTNMQIIKNQLPDELK